MNFEDAIKDVVKTQSEEEFTLNKNVMAGTSKKVTAKIYLFKSGLFVFDKIDYIPSLFKIIDELIVNAIDHTINCINKDTMQHRMAKKLNKTIVNRYVNTIAFAISDKNGLMCIYNDGYGIPIVKFGDSYLPEKLFTETRTGTNTENDSNRVTGGTNGCGAALLPPFAKYLEFDIQDENYIYNQTMERSGRKSTKDCFSVPVIKPNKDPNNQFTKIRFNINWASTLFKTCTAKTLDLFKGYIIKRLIQTSLYIKHVIKNFPTLKMPNVVFKNIDGSTKNYNKITNDDLENYFGLFRVYETFIEAKKNNTLSSMTNYFTLYIGINKIDNQKYSEMSIINGVEVNINPLIKIIRSALINSIVSYCGTKNIIISDKNKLKNLFTFVMVACIADPQWIGQSKESFTIDKQFLQQFNIVGCYEQYKDEILKITYETIVCKEIKRKRTNKVKISDIRGYQKCVNIVENGNSYSRPANTKNKVFYLFITEGDSASSFIINILDKRQYFSIENSGCIMMKGVIINTFHKINLYSTANMEFHKEDFGKGVQHKLMFHKKVEANSFVTNLMAVLNLSPSMFYTSPDQVNTLLYNKIICSTDSDYDGWNITGLLFVLISKWFGLTNPEYHTDYPNKRLDFIKLLHLPIIRIIPSDLSEKTSKELKTKKKLSLEFINSIVFWEFFTVGEYEEFIKTNKIPNTHIVKYYKGLATTDKFFGWYIAFNIKKYLFSVYFDSKAMETLELFYGKVKIVTDNKGNSEIKNLADDRKEMLRKPIREMTPDEYKIYKNNKIITVTAFLEVFVKQYFLDNIKRKLPKLLDGYNNVCTKMNYVIPDIFPKTKNLYTKIGIIAPRIAEKTGYHHGSNNIIGVVRNSGQTFYGARLYSPFISEGMWGDRSDGGEKSAGEPRYIDAKCNHKYFDALFPHDDKIILDYQEEDGEVIEPKYLLPIIPMVILDNYKTTAHGWKVEIYGRELNEVLNYLIMNKIHGKNIIKKVDGVEVRQFIMPDKRNLECGRDSLFMYEDISKDPSEVFTYSCGKYKIIPKSQDQKYDIINIISLPLGVWTKNYVSSLKNKTNIENEEENNVSKNKLDEIIKSVNSYSSENVDIRIEVVDGWREKFNVLYKVKNVNNNEKDFNEDPILIMLGLKVRLCDFLNIINPNGEVITYNNYKDVIDDWFIIRHQYYQKRIDRLIVIKNIDLIKLKNKINYLEKFNSLNLRNKTIAQREEILINRGFNKFREINFYNIRNNVIPNENIHSLVFEDKKSSFKYLTDIKTGAINQNKIDSLKEKLTKLESELDELKQPDIIKKVWLKELQNLKLVLEEFY